MTDARPLPRSQANVLRRALSPEEFADVLHYEVCWIDDVVGDRITPLLRRGNAYVAVTSTRVHIVRTKGAHPAASSIPLDEIDDVETHGAVEPGFFYSYIYGEPDAMMFAKRHTITRRKKHDRHAAELRAAAAARRGARTLAGAELAAAREPAPSSDPRDAFPHVADATATAEIAAEERSERIQLMANKVATALALVPDGFTAKELATMLKEPKKDVDDALAALRRSGAADAKEQSWGRATRWTAAAAPEPAGPVTESTAGAPSIAIDPEATRRAAEEERRVESRHHAGWGLSASEASSPPDVGGDPPASAAQTSAKPAATFDVHAAVDFANKRTIDRVEREMEREAEAEEANAAAAGGRKSANAESSSSAEEVRRAARRNRGFAIEKIKIISLERGSQVTYQLERACLRRHASRASRGDFGDLNRGATLDGGATSERSSEPGDLTAPAEASAALRVARVPDDLLGDEDAVAAAADDGDAGVSMGAVVIAADAATLLDGVTRAADGLVAFHLPEPSPGDETAEPPDALPAPPPAPEALVEDPPKTDEELAAAEAAASALRAYADLAKSPSDETSGALAVPSAAQPSVEAERRALSGLLLAMPLKPALTVAVAATAAARARMDAEAEWREARRDGEPDSRVFLGDVTDDRANATAPARRDVRGGVKARAAVVRKDLDTVARETFGTLELAALAPRDGAEIGAGVVVENVGMFEAADLCAFSAMAEHAKRAPARFARLALGSEKLFDVVAARLERAAFEATHAHPLLRRRRRFPLDEVPDEHRAAANWARLLCAARQGCAAHRAAQLLAFVRGALAGSEGAPFERLDLAAKKDALETIVAACFAYNPIKHPAMASVEGGAGGGEDARRAAEEEEEMDVGERLARVDFRRLRAPEGASSDGVLDLVTDALYELIQLSAHAHLMGGGDGWFPSHAVAAAARKRAPPRDVKPRVANMFRRLVNVVLDAPDGAVRGAASVRAHRVGFVLRHLMEGMPDAAVARCIRDEYDAELRFVFSRREVYDRTVRGGDAHFERFARPHFDYVMAQVLPTFGAAGRAAAREEAAEAMRERVRTRGEEEKARATAAKVEGARAAAEREETGDERTPP